MNIGDNIRKLRIEKDISQFRLSEVSGVPQTTISNIERDRGNTKCSKCYEDRKSIKYSNRRSP